MIRLLNHDIKTSVTTSFYIQILPIKYSIKVQNPDFFFISIIEYGIQTLQLDGNRLMI